MKNKNKRILISGYFDPFHIGHLDLIKRARKFGNYLIVIVDNDKQARLKKGKAFMPENERVAIMKSIKGVDKVILSIDKDKTSCKTIEMMKPKPDILVNGGDRIDGTIPEQETCERLGIKMINNVGKKLQSSSALTGLNKLIK